MRSRSSPTGTTASARGKVTRGEQRPTSCGMQVDVNLQVESPKIRQMNREALKRRGFQWGAILIVLICLGSLLKITVREAFLKNPQFSLKQVVVRTEGTVSAQKIVRTSALTQGTNLLTVKMREIEARLLQLPQVKKVKIQRDYNGRLTLEVSQRQPIAWVENAKLGTKAGEPEIGYFMDATGVLFPAEQVTDTDRTLPVIHHGLVRAIEPGLELNDLQTRAAQRLMTQLQERQFELGLPPVKAIHLQHPWALEVHLADAAENFKVTFGVDDLEEQLGRFDRVWAEARHRKWKLETVNVLVRYNMPITFREAPNIEGLQDPVTASVTAPISTSTQTLSR